MKNAFWIACYIISVIGILLGCFIAWGILCNMVDGYGMNWIATAIAAVIIGVFSQMNNKLVEWRD